jgi:transcriptional regulator with XRE-family HTH domain
MTEVEIIKTIMKSKKVNQTELSNRMGYAGQGALGRALSNKNGMRTDVLIKMVRALGCDLIIRDRDNMKEYAVRPEENDVEYLKKKMAEMQKQIEALTNSHDVSGGSGEDE